MTGSRRPDVLIIGAGFIGLSTAWALAEKDPTLRIEVVDAGEFASGGAGRNGSGYRLQWSQDFNIHLVRDSLRVFQNAEELLDYRGGVEVNPQGYLMLAHSAEAWAALRAAVEQQNRAGVPTELLGPDDCLRIQPELNLEGLHGASFCPLDGTASPFKWLDALYQACKRAGVAVRYGTKVLSIERCGSRFEARTPDGTISSEKIVLCTDWAAPELLAPIGIDLPVTRTEKEALVTEPSMPLVRTVIMAGAYGLGIKQLVRGNVIITLSRSSDSRLAPPKDWLSDCARRATHLLPATANLKVIRQWNGVISRTPDMQPILGETELLGLYVAVAAYKGFMISPEAGRIMADLILDGHSGHLAAAALSPHRFHTNSLVPETLTI